MGARRIRGLKKTVSRESTENNTGKMLHSKLFSLLSLSLFLQTNSLF